MFTVQIRHFHLTRAHTALGTVLLLQRVAVAVRPFNNFGGKTLSHGMIICGYCENASWLVKSFVQVGSSWPENSFHMLTTRTLRRLRSHKSPT